ncbi:MAG: amidohydrolase family protein [Thermoanaerobaculia bacterium]
MKLRILALAVLALPALGLAEETSPKTEIVVLKAARLFSGKGETTIRDAVVIVEGGKIKAVGSALEVPAGAKVVDLGDATLLPGFIDSHTHVSGESENDWNAAFTAGLRRTVPEVALRASVYARNLLMAGFTTIRDLGSGDSIDVGLRNTARDGIIAGPRMLVSVHALGARGGHCDATGFPYELFGPEPGIEQGIASGPDQFRDAVRFQVKYGADVIKVCATGGVLSLADEVDTPQITQDEMNAIVDEAHRLRKKAAAHAHGAEGAKVAIRAGIDSIEHGSFLDDEALRMMKDRGTWLVPTLLAGEYATAPERKYPPEIAEKARAAMAKRSETFRKAVKMGIKIAFGTDSGVSPHGVNAREFKLMVDHGMTPAAALRAATASAAELLGISRLTGTLEAGKEADIVAVPGDPLADVTATERVAFVMKHGRIYKLNGEPTGF